MTVFYKWLAGLSIQTLIIGAIVLFYEGVFLFNWWPLNQVPYAGWVIKGEITRRIEDHDLERNRKRELELTTRRIQTEKTLGESEGVRNEKTRQRSILEAQRRIDVANGTSLEREAFFKQEAQANLDRVIALQALLKNYENLPTKTKTKVVKEYVTKFKTRKPVFPGDAKPSASFMREYERLNTEARKLGQ